MSARGGIQRRLIATTFVAGFGALLFGAVTSRDAQTVAATGDAQKESKAVSAHDLASQAIQQFGQPSSQRVTGESSTMRFNAADDSASKALRQSSLPSSRRAVSENQPTPQETPAGRNSDATTALYSDATAPVTSGNAVGQMRLPPPPASAGGQTVIPVAGTELANLALQQAGAPSSRRQQSTSASSPAHYLAESSVNRLQVPVMPVSNGSDRSMPAMSTSSISDDRNGTVSALNSRRQDGEGQGAPPVANQDGDNQGAESVPPPSGEPRTFGEEPETDTSNTLLFLRDDTVLLQPGEWQFDIGLQYAQNTQDFATVTQLNNNTIFVGELIRRQRTLQAPMEIRLGLSPGTQGFVNVPFGWANTEIAFGGNEEFSNTGGIGDVSWGITKRLVKGNEICPEILGTVAWSAPTGDVTLIDSLGTPGTSLGEGFWTMRGDLVFIQNYDPVVVFYGFGYRHRFNNKISGFYVDPGQQAFYRLGVGFAVNPQVTLSTTFFGNYLGSDVVDGVRVAGGIREPMSLRFAATVAPRDCHGFRTVEPFCNIGLTESAIDTIIGITWTR